MILLLTSNIKGDFELLKLVRENENFMLQLDCGNNQIDDATLTGNNIISVRGALDKDSKFPPLRLLDIEGVKILLLNGEKESVVFGTEVVEQKAHEFKADVAIFGTVDSQISYKKGNTLYLNPGAFGRDKTYLLLVFKESKHGNKPELEVIRKTIEYEE